MHPRGHEDLHRLAFDVGRLPSEKALPSRVQMHDAIVEVSYDDRVRQAVENGPIIHDYCEPGREERLAGVLRRSRAVNSVRVSPLSTDTSPPCARTI